MHKTFFFYTNSARLLQSE